MQHSSREQRDAAVEKLRQKYASKVTVLQDRLRRSEQAVAKEKEQRSASFLSVGADIFGVVFGRKSATTAIRSASRTYKEQSDIGRAEETYTAVKQQLEDLQAQIESEAAEIQTQMDASTAALETISVKPKKTNINIRMFTLAWAPYAKDSIGRTEAGLGLSACYLLMRVAAAFCPRPHSSCTAWTAFSRPERATTITIVSSLDPCAMAMMLMFSREIAVKMRPASPGVPCIPSPTTASSPTSGIHFDRLQVIVLEFQLELGLQPIQRRLQFFLADQEAKVLPITGA